jgi:SAM-dependent methyltransferase
MSIPVISMAEFNRQYETLLKGMDADTYQRMCSTAVAVPGVERLKGLEPFSNEYKNAVLELHAELRGRADVYDPAEHEQADPGHFNGPNPFTDTVPWQFRDASFVSQHLFSWAMIFNALELKGTGRVLEYGPGSGQILLQLARCGIEAYGVDIDQRWLDQIAQQAEAMGLHVHLERNTFGRGFDGVLFDRIVFFEAFHHAIDFLDVLSMLRKRLAKDGRIVFCGEPVSPIATSAIPYPWGPRLDGASLYCTRRCGWMELGFTHDFFAEALARTGYEVEHHPFPICERASCYVARPASGARGTRCVTVTTKAGRGTRKRGLRRLLSKVFRRR